jgi:hypothetical protein
MFQLITPTTVRLKHINLRQETHGKHKVDAIDLDFVLEGRNLNLALLHPDLCAAHYHDPDADAGQETAEGVEQVLPKRRFPQAGPIPWDDVTTGTDLTVIYGLGDDDSNIDMTGGKTATKRIELKEDAVAHIFFRYSTTNFEDGALDKLRKKLDQVVEVTLVQNEQLRKEAIDGSVDAFKRDHPEAGDIFSDMHGGDEDSDSEGGTTDVSSSSDGWPFPGKADGEAPPQSVTVETSRPGTRTARGREKTKAALAVREGATH